MITKCLCSTCDHDIRFEDRSYGLLVAECKLGCEQYDPHEAIECNKWESQR